VGVAQEDFEVNLLIGIAVLQGLVSLGVALGIFGYDNMDWPRAFTLSVASLALLVIALLLGAR
jgi:thiamine transporter ThiT